MSYDLSEVSAVEREITLPSDGTYFVTAPHWRHSYVGHIRGDTTTLFTSRGWWGYDTETLVRDGARFLKDGRDYRDPDATPTTPDSGAGR